MASELRARRFMLIKHGGWWVIVMMLLRRCRVDVDHTEPLPVIDRTRPRTDTDMGRTDDLWEARKNKKNDTESGVWTSSARHRRCHENLKTRRSVREAILVPILMLMLTRRALVLCTVQRKG